MATEEEIKNFNRDCLNWFKEAVFTPSGRFSHYRPLTEEDIPTFIELFRATINKAKKLKEQNGMAINE